MNKLIVGISDMKTSKSDDIIITYALGSCVGICIYDSSSKIGGMAHIMLPSSTMDATKSNPYKFADTAIDSMVKKLVAMGATKIKLRAKIAGGAQMFPAINNASISNIGSRNVTAVKQALGKAFVPIIAEDTGSNYGRTVVFHLEDGSVEIKSASMGNKKL